MFCFIAVLLLAYMKGNANLCRAIVRAGARLGVNNNQGINIFNYQVATKQLLFRLLGNFAPFIIDRVDLFYFNAATRSCNQVVISLKRQTFPLMRSAL